MKVMNYYAMDKEELNEKIDKIRYWIFYNQKDEKFQTALFALDVALCARKLSEDGNDDFTSLMLDSLI